MRNWNASSAADRGAATAGAAETFSAMGYAVEEGAAPYDPGELAGLWSVVAEAGLAWHLAKMGAWRGRVGENAIRMADAGVKHTATDYVAALDGIAEHAKAANVPVELTVWDDMWHGFQLFASVLPEGQQSLEQMGRFIRLQTKLS